MEPYGGVRVILNWCKYIDAAGHTVTLNSVNGWMSTPWFQMPDSVQVRQGWPADCENYDVVISTNPDTTLFLWDKPAPRKFYLMQMAEELFNPAAEEYAARCVRAAKCPFPVITVAEWITQWYADVRRGPMYVVPNGIDDDFQYTKTKNENRTVVLVEGWESNNSAKDVEGITPQAIEQLKKDEKLYVVGYGQRPAKRHAHLLDEYYEKPSTKMLAQLYNAAHFFVKASKYETRSLAPLEAMACGAIPIISCIQGHPDVFHRYNGFRAQYDVDDLVEKIRVALRSERRELIRFNGIMYRQHHMRWEKVINNYVLSILEQ